MCGGGIVWQFCSYMSTGLFEDNKYLDFLGLTALSLISDMMDIKVFVDADADDRLIRVINRDCIERGRTPELVVERYERVLKPMHNKYIEPAKKYADLIIPQGGNNTVAIKLLKEYIEGRINTRKE